VKSVVFLRVHALYLSVNTDLECRLAWHAKSWRLGSELHCIRKARCLHYAVELRLRRERQVSCTVLLKCLLCFPTWNIVTCILCMDFAMPMHVLLFKNTKGVFPIEGFPLEVYLRALIRHCVILVLFRVFLCSLKGRWYERLTHERTFFRWFREVHVSPPVEWPLASAYRECKWANFT